MNEKCEVYGEGGRGNLKVRKVYGKERIRYLRCKECGKEFSERKGTALWNSKISTEKFAGVVEHLSEGVSLSGTSRLCKVHHETVKRIAEVSGEQGEKINEVKGVGLRTSAISFDERYGYVGRKGEEYWEGSGIEMKSRYVLSLVMGKRDEAMVEKLLRDSHKRLRNPRDVVVFSDGGHGYDKLFAEVFGVPYLPKKASDRGRPCKPRYRIPRTLALVQVIKHREGKHLKTVDIRYTYGSKKRVALELARLGHSTPNTAYIERNNATFRLFNPHMHRKSLAFSRHPSTRDALARLVRLDYNWVKPCRSLSLPVAEPLGRQRYLHRTPAMALGIATRPFSLLELLATPFHALTFLDSLPHSPYPR